MNAVSPVGAGAENQTPGQLIYAHTLSLRLSNLDYRRLRRFVAAQEERLGHRLTHQSVLELALRQFLEVRASGQAD